jgi:hypothetical protein
MLSTVGQAIDQTSRKGLTPASGCAAEALMAMTGEGEVRSYRDRGVFP